MEGTNSAPSPAVNKSTYEAVALDDQELKVNKVEPEPEPEPVKVGFVPVTAPSVRTQDLVLGNYDGRRYFQVRHLVSQPLKIRMMRTESTLVLVRSWWTRSSFCLVLFTILWNSFMIFVIGLFIWIKFYVGVGISLLHTLIGFFMAYHCICLMYNSTTIVVTHQAVSVEHGPLPTGTKPSLAIDLSTVRVLCCCEVKENDKRVFWVVAVREDREKILFISFEEVDDALFVEQEMERFLGLREIPTHEVV